MRLFNHIIEVSLRSRQPWTHFKVHKYQTYKHIVWGRLSIIMGQPHLETVLFCRLCESPNCSEQGLGDESWTICDDCGAIEQGYLELTIEDAENRGLI